MTQIFLKCINSCKITFILTIVLTNIFIEYNAYARKGYQGCCSHHGGISHCDYATGRIVCRDGTYSRSCGCPKIVGETKTIKNNEAIEIKKSSFDNFNNTLNYSTNSYSKSTRDNDSVIRSIALLNLMIGYEIYFLNVNTEPHYNAYSEIKLNVKPIHLAFIQIDATIPLFFFRGIYKYKFYRQNGDIIDDKETYIDEITNNKKLQYFLYYAAGFLGFEFNQTLEYFNYGKYQYFVGIGYNDERNIYMGENYFSVKKNQIDIRYHFNWMYIEKLGGIFDEQRDWDIFILYRYLSYNIPGIIYTSRYDGDPPCGESLPQIINYKIHYGGLGFENNNKQIKDGINFLFGFTLSFGLGHTVANLNDYRYNTSEFPEDYDPLIDRRKKLYVYGLALSGNIGIIYKFIESYLNLSLKIDYSYNLYGIDFAENISKIMDDDSDNYEKNEYCYETADDAWNAFHSIKFSVQIEF